MKSATAVGCDLTDCSKRGVILKENHNSEEVWRIRLGRFSRVQCSSPCFFCQFGPAGVESIAFVLCGVEFREGIL